MNVSSETGDFIKKLAKLAGLLLAALGVFLYVLFAPARNFPVAGVFKVEKGDSLTAVASELRVKGFIRSRSLFKLVVLVAGEQENLQAGDYFFERPLSLVGVARRIGNGNFGIETLKVTIPEGYNVRQIGEHFEKMGISAKQEFLKIAASEEGFLFPDTYFFFKNSAPEELTDRMKKNFERKITSDILAEISRQGKTLREIIIMASLLEEEAKTAEDRKIVAGILWKRLAAGAALQVDATLAYITGRTSRELTNADLKLNSPYNTYRYPGLPVGPISSPGLEAIDASLHPAPSPYWYYLSDKGGNIHYAKTFEEHKQNRFKYLR